MSELDILASDLSWMRKNMEKQDRLMSDIDKRLRQIETELASIQANQKPPINSWTVFGIIATGIVSALLVIDRFVN